MSKVRKDSLICLLMVFLATTGLLMINKLLFNQNLLNDMKPEYVWIYNGLRNIFSYSVILLPGYLVYKYLYLTKYFDRNGNGNAYLENGCITSIIRRCFDEHTFLVDEHLPSQQSTPLRQSFTQECIVLMLYFMGLQISFLTWGVLQEKVMTRAYTDSNGDTGHFSDSQFLVFINRILAFLTSAIILLCKKQHRDRTPLYKYVYCSLSNIVSSWCQYEALKYVSFPHQVLAKAAKVIPVMIMGKFVSKLKYDWYEYATALLLSVGMLMFMIETETNKGSSTATTVSGFALLLTYIISDSFTSNWQSGLFKQYDCSPLQMMCGVNMFSCLFTAISLILQDSLVSSISFMIRFPYFIIDCLLLSICSAAGQLLIFRTIAVFGPLVFALITTIRQGFAVLLSCIIYRHHISLLGVLGVTLVFLSILVRIYCNYRIKSIRRRLQTLNNSKLEL